MLKNTRIYQRRIYNSDKRSFKLRLFQIMLQVMPVGRIVEWLKAQQASIYFRAPGLKIKQMCFITGRSRSVNMRTGLSRMLTRDKLSTGLLTGVTKSSW